MSVIFYLAVVHEVFLFGAETWVLLEEISRNLEGVHAGFFRQVTVQKSNRQRDRTWIILAASRVLKESGTQTLGM